MFDSGSLEQNLIQENIVSCISYFINESYQSHKPFEVRWYNCYTGAVYVYALP